MFVVLKFMVSHQCPRSPKGSDGVRRVIVTVGRHWALQPAKRRVQGAISRIRLATSEETRHGPAMVVHREPLRQFWNGVTTLVAPSNEAGLAPARTDDARRRGLACPVDPIRSRLKRRVGMGPSGLAGDSRHCQEAPSRRTPGSVPTTWLSRPE